MPAGDHWSHGAWPQGVGSGGGQCIESDLSRGRAPVLLGTQGRQDTGQAGEIVLTQGQVYAARNLTG